MTPDQEPLFRDALDLLAKKLAEDEATLGVMFPYVTAPDGSWKTLPASLSAGYAGEAWSHGNWFCGFWVGLHLIAHVYTGDDRHLTWARERMRLVSPRAADPNTHDIGFIFESSAIPGFYLTGEAWLADAAVEAAGRLRARLVTTPRGAYIASWGPLDDPRGRASSAIDTMANLPLLYWAAGHTGDASFRLCGQAHADMTAGAFIRDDHSTYHAVEYDAATGERRRSFTFQGYADESCWSRGQAWAVYGYAATAGATGVAGYLERAERLAQAYLARLGDDTVPPWDFDDPAVDAPRDSAAAAVVAAAFLDMGALHPDAAAGAAWRERGLAMLADLCRTTLAREPAHRGLLRHSCYSKPHDEGVDSATLFGDWFFAAAMADVLYPGRLRPRLASLT